MCISKYLRKPAKLDYIIYVFYLVLCVYVSHVKHELQI